MEFSPRELEHYSRQIRLCDMGIEGQKKLKSAAILVVGAGGLGCSALQSLAAAGAGRLGIIDPDRVELSNLCRQPLYRNSDIGRLKVDCAQESLRVLNLDVKLEGQAIALTSQNARELIAAYDIVLDATDNAHSRYAIDEACHTLEKIWIYASIHQFEGQLAVFDKNFGYRDLYPSPPACLGSCSLEGVLGPLPGILGAMQALEAIKMIAGIEPNLLGQLLLVSTKSWKMARYALRPNSDARSLEIEADELIQMRKRGVSFQFIDVRLPEERSSGHLGGRAIPFPQLLDLAETLSHADPIVLYCQKGHRSLSAAKQLQKKLKRASLFSLRGGLSALTLEQEQLLSELQLH